ncbi:hypothetical protein MPNE_0320 [Mycoplasmoides pneumoniae FH]|uniref:Uncharacterized protein n=1 Tax=Mycoplasmoides pneumoniae (strain ATCC 15531 / DSM 23978 / CIP 103766 / NBRC 14401 / NCTC 10119 / FH) TaxID=722438 RepID=A0A0H3DN57_MYCPB|nr:hypothetical protein MPNE_0320 [Mycoplasmoides pneumoniae FH]
MFFIKTLFLRTGFIETLFDELKFSLIYLLVFPLNKLID